MTMWIHGTGRHGRSNLNCTCSCMSVLMMIYHPKCGAIEMRTLVALLHKEGEGGVVWDQFKQCPPQPLTNSKYTRGLFALGSFACKLSLVSEALGWGANVLGRLVPATYRCSGPCKKKNLYDTWIYIYIIHFFPVSGRQLLSGLAQLLTALGWGAYHTCQKPCGTFGWQHQWGHWGPYLSYSKVNKYIPPLEEGPPQKEVHIIYNKYNILCAINTVHIYIYYACGANTWLVYHPGPIFVDILPWNDLHFLELHL